MRRWGINGGEWGGGANTMVKVLIQGHTKSYDHHFMKSFIEQRSRIDYPGQTVQYETADIEEGATHVIDAFNPEEKFHDSFDTLWLPDLGGEWYLRQKDSGMRLKTRAGMLLLSIQAASAVVKPGGHIYVFKFHDQEKDGYTGEVLIQEIINNSNRRRAFATAESIIGTDDNPGIHFVKHAASTSAPSHGVKKRLRLRINLA